MPVLVNNLQDSVPVDEKLLQRVTEAVETVLAQTGTPEMAEVSIVFVDDAYITRLNQQYRHLDGATDVLSFAQMEGEPMPREEQELLLGDVVISLETAGRQAEEYGHSFNQEVSYLVVHGVLHLLGYDHQSEPDRQQMRDVEKKVLARVWMR